MKKKSFLQKNKLNTIIHLFISVLKLKIILIILALSLLFLFFSYLELRKDYVLIEPFNVPKDFEKYGFTGRVIAIKLNDQISFIKTTAATRMERIPFVPIWNRTYLDIEIKEYGISFNSLIQYIRRFLGCEITRIVGEITCIDGKINYKVPLFFTIRTSNGTAKTLPGNLENLDDVLLQAAEHIYKYTQPYVLASYLYNINDIITCREVIQYLVSHEPTDDDSWGYNLWGLLLSNKKRDQEGAINMFQRAIELDRKFTFPYYNWGCSLLEKKDYEGAIDKFDKVIRLDSKDAYAYYGWGRALLFGQNKPEVAIDKFNMAIKYNKRLDLGYSGRGCCFAYCGQYEKALEDFKQSVASNPNNSADYLNMCETSLYTGDYDDIFFYSNEVLHLSNDSRNVILSFYYQCIAEKILGVDTRETEKTFETVVNNRDSFEFTVYEFKAPYTIDKLCQAINADNLPIKVPVNTINTLNELLKDTGFYIKLCQKNNYCFSTEVKKLAKQIKKTAFNEKFLCLDKDEQIKIVKLNRLLLQEIYPRRTPKIKNPTFRIKEFELIEKWLNVKYSEDEFRFLDTKKLYEIINKDIKLNLTASDKSIKWVQELLTVPNFYDILHERKPDLKFPTYIMNLVCKTNDCRTKNVYNLDNKAKNNIKRLNFLLLKKTYPQEIRKRYSNKWFIRKKTNIIKNISG